jgi:lysophospholipase L1-like esterase
MASQDLGRVLRILGAGAAIAGAYIVGECIYVRLVTPRLPPAGGERKKERGPVKLYVAGDSVASGCGIEAHDMACAGVHADAFGEELAVGVSYEVYGKIGYTTRQIQKLCEDKLPRGEGKRPDIIMISTGVNDIITLSSSAKFRRNLEGLLDTVDELTESHSLVIMLGIPPMGMFTALPPLLQLICGWRARHFDAIMGDVCSSRVRVAHNSFGLLTPPEEYTAQGELLAPDGFHPGTGGLRWVADRAKTFLAGPYRGAGSRIEMGPGVV